MLTGRTSERTAIERLLDAGSRHQSGSLMIRGEPGSGKSALLDYARECAGGFRILSSTGTGDGLAFDGLHELVYPILDHVSDMPEVQARALEGALALGEPQNVGRLYIGAAALSLLAAAAVDRPVVCLVDDAHLLDQPSADAMSFAARRLGAESVVMVFTVRHVPGASTAAGIEELRLTGLAEDDAIELLQARFPTIRVDVARRIAQGTGGNPLALIEAARRLGPTQLAGEDDLPHPLPVGEALVPAFLERTQDLSDPARDALLIAATSDTGTMRVMPDLDDELEEAEDAGLVVIREGRYTFTHPLVRAAIYEAATPAERRAAHRSVAEALDGHERYRVHRAHHLAAAATGPDEDLAATVEDAAAAASERRANGPSASLYERAAHLSLEESGRGRRSVRAAHGWWLAGQPERARKLLEEAPTDPLDPVTSADATLLSARVDASIGRPVDPRALDGAAAAVFAIDPGRAALLWAAAADASGGDDAIAFAEHATTAAPPGTAAEPLALLARGRALTSAGQPGGADEVARASELVRSRDDLHDDPEVLVELVDHLAEVDVDAGLEEEILELASHAAREHTLMLLPRTLLRRSQLEHARGAWLDAYAHASEAERLFDETGQSVARAGAQAWLGYLEALRGHEERARELAAAVREARPTEFSERGLACGRVVGMLELVLDRPAAAVDGLVAWARRAPGPGALLPVSVFDVVDAVVAIVRSGADRARCSELVALLPEGSSRSDVASAWSLALLAEPSDGDAAYEATMAQADPLSSTMPFEHARLLLNYGEYLRRRGERARAREHLRSALSAFEAMGAEPWAERARRELTATGETARKRSDPDLDQLTPQELQVARAIARGATYKEAAAQLYLSPKTIEFHIGKVYRKLGIRSGRELAALMAQGEVPVS